MADEGFKRKLTAILSADVEGYSRLMDDDEEATIRTLTDYREAMRNLIQQHRGRVVDTTGDNLLAEFKSAVDAVNCSVEIQRELAERNTELPYERRMEFRIGVNVGDVVEEEDRIYGDGVNIAARVEGLAEAGGICISGRVYDQVENKLDLEFEYLGEQEVKNIARPISVYRVLSYPGAAAHRVVKAKDAVRKKWRKIALATAAVLVVAIAVATIWNFYLRPPSVEVASVEKMAHPLPDKPSIVVLPFDNLSKDPDQDYLVDGITDQIITGLSMIPHMFVIARESSFSYKKKDVEIRQISEELGVQYVLEGSVQVSGNRIRITALLIDALSGHHIWSERYDRELEDIFALQDEIMIKIMQAMQLKVAGLAILDNQPAPPSVEAFDKISKAIVYVYRYNKNDMAHGRKLYEEAIALSPEYGPAYRLLAWTHFHDSRLGYSESPAESLKKAEELANKAVSLGDDKAYSLLSQIYLRKGQYDKAITIGEKGLANSSNWPQYPANFSWVLTLVGRDDEAISLIEKAIRLNPNYPYWYIGIAGACYFNVRRYEEALEASKQCVQKNPNFVHGWIFLAASYSLLERDDKARETAKEMLKIFPGVSIKQMASLLPYKDPARQKLWLDALRKAGVPENPPLQLPDKPSIAVMAFENMSGEPEQKYFSDGLSEEIITALSKTPKLFVIARNSSFSYKGIPVKVQQIGRELGVKYVLEGSVRKSGNRVRITAQLIDAKTGNHLWAERYDRDLKDIFAIQDDITKQIIAALYLKLTIGEDARLLERGTNSFEAYLKYLQAREYHYRFTKEDNLIGRRLAEEVISIDPEYAAPYSLIGATHMLEVWFQTTNSPKQSMGKAIELTRKAIDLGEDVAHALLGFLYLQTRQYDEAIAECQKAVDLIPNSATARTFYGLVLKNTGRFEEAVHELEQGLRLDPFSSSFSLRSLADAYSFMGRHEEAIAIGKKATQKAPNDMISHIILTRAYSAAGRMGEAKTVAAEILRINPKFSLELYAKRLSNKNRADKDRVIDELRRAGLK
jgi:TolB-like protein/class 3 adenylate cyclase/predicted Zn-dependent protease